MRLPSTEMRRRVLHGLIIFLFLFAALMFRVGWIQIVMGEELTRAAFEARIREIEIQPRRGLIFDSSGREMAVSVDVDSLYAIPAEVDEPHAAAENLAPLLGMDEGVLLDRLTRGASFVWLKRKLPPDTAQEVRDLELSGLYFTKESERFYPKGSLAAHLLGFAGVDSQGLEGIERGYDEILRGDPGKISMEFDAEGREIPQAVYDHREPVPGDNIYLTIDEMIQYIAERELAEVVSETGASGGHIMLMEPDTGRILAMASHPSYDPNQWSQVPADLWRNPMVSETQHPGSVFKPVTAAAALEEGVVTPDTEFYDPGYVQVPGAVIHNWNRQGLSDTDFFEGFAHSANVVFVKTALELGRESFYRYVEAFGLDGPTGIRLPGEAEGIYPPHDTARPVDVAVMSFGQTLTVTPIQMLSAISALVNDGELLRPQVVSSVENAEDESREEVAPEVIRRAVSVETAQTVQDMMVAVVEEGTGSQARVPGYRVGGKTGTAQKTVDGVVSEDQHLASFVGFVPADDPAFVCYVVVDEPEDTYYGGMVAAPVFSSVAQEVLRYLDIPPSHPEEIEEAEDDDEEDLPGVPEVESLGMPDFVGRPVEEVEELAAEKGLHLTVVGDGPEVEDQFPAPGAEVRAGTGVLIYTRVEPADASEDDTVRVPNLADMSLREAAEELRSIGLRMEISGSGIIKGQEPGPGARVPEGTIIQLRLESP